MGPFKSSIDKLSASYQKNHTAMMKKLAKLEACYQHQPAALKPLIAQDGKMDVWSRIHALIDPGAPFLELMPLAGYSAHLCGAICGVGQVNNKWVIIFANDPRVKGGTLTAAVYRKWARSIEIAKTLKIPYISLVQSAGFDLRQSTHEESVQMPHFAATGREFYDLTQLSANNIPTICVVFGSATAGGAYQPGLSDYTILIEDQAEVYLAGPPLLKMATGQVVDGQSLGGASMHAKQSGLGDYLCRTEYEGILQCRKLLNHIPQTTFESKTFVEPQYPLDDLLGWLDPELKHPVDARELITRICDASWFDEFKPQYGVTVSCVWATIFGHPVGIVANQGVIMPAAAKKMGQFIQLCNARRCPVIFLHNTTGFMVGKEYEQNGIIKDGSQLINIVSNSKVPHISIIFGASYGAGTYAMSGYAFENHFTFTWPNARVGVMGERQLAGVLSQLDMAKASKQGSAIDDATSAAIADQVAEEALKKADAFYVSKMCADDGIIDPRDTRVVLGMTVSLCYQAGIEGADQYGVFRF